MVLLQVEERDPSRAPKHVRRDGLVPMALVEPGLGTRLVQAPLTDVQRVLSRSSGVGMFELQVKGESKTRTVVIKQLDRDVLKRQLLNLSVMQITRDQVLTSDVPIHQTGTPVPVTDHIAVLVSPTGHVRLKGKAMDIPGTIEVDVSALQIGDSISAGQVGLPEGIELASSADAVLFSLQPLRAEIEEAPAVEGEESAEPELVGKSADEEGSS